MLCIAVKLLHTTLISVKSFHFEDHTIFRSVGIILRLVYAAVNEAITFATTEHAIKYIIIGFCQRNVSLTA